MGAKITPPEHLLFLVDSPQGSDVAPIFGTLSQSEKLCVIKPHLGGRLELVSKQLSHLAAILHVYARGLIFMK